MYRVGDFDYKKLINASNNINLPSNSNVANLIAKSMHNNYIPIDENRSMIDRVFDVLSIGNYVTAGMARGIVRDDMTILGGAIDGLRASNPFGEGYTKGEHTYSKVLDDIGWQPTSTAGKIARGAVGFVCDVMLDPTTYLSGGASALIKGTGKTGAKLTHAVGEMTQEIAESIIKKQAVKRGLSLSSADLAKDAEKLVSHYNKIAGIRGTADDVTLSLANAPFGKKIFGKNADASKTLFKGEDIQKLSDDIGLSTQYSKLRDKIYGSKLGELFSSKSTLYNLSKTEPEAVYDFLKFTEHTRGLTKDIQLAKKAIYDKAKDLNLSPEETNQVIKMMEDKSIWSTVKKYVSFSETKEAQIYKKRVQETKLKTQKELDDLLDVKKSVESMQFAKADELFENDEILNSLREELRDKLSNLKVSRIDDEKSLNDIVNALNDEINNLKVEGNVYTKSSDKIERTSEDFLKNYDAYRQTKEIYDSTDNKVIDKIVEETQLKGQHLDNLNTFVIKPDKVTDKYYSGIIKQLQNNGYVKMPNSESVDNFTEHFKNWTAEFDLDEGIYKLFPPANQKDKIIKTVKQSIVEKPNKGKIVEDISNFLYGKSDMISPTTWDKNIDKVVEMIRRGTPDEEIISYIEKHSDFYNGRANMIYPYVAKEIGYDKWEDYYEKPIKELTEKMQLGKLTIEDKKMMAELQQSKLKRDKMIRMFNNMETDEIRKMVDGVDGIDDSINSIEDMIYKEQYGGLTNDEIRRDEFIKSDSALDETQNLNTPSNKNFKTDFSDKSVYGKAKLSYNGDFYNSGKYEVREGIIEKLLPNYDISKPNKGYERMIGAITTEAETVLNDFFKKEYVDLSPKQKDLLIDKAIQEYNKKFNKINIVNSKKIADSQKTKITESLKRRKETQRINHISNNMKKGATVTLKSAKGDDIEGIVKELYLSGDNPVADIVKYDGSELKGVGFDNILNFKNDVEILTSDEIVNMSNIAKEFTKKQNSLIQELNSAKDKLKNLDVKYEGKYSNLINYYAKRAEEVQSNIKNIEVNMQHLQDALTNGELTKIDRLSNRVKKYDEILSNDDVFETYVRAHLGDERVNEIIFDNSPFITRLMLDSDMPVSDKVQKIVMDLRKEFLNIGSKEVSINKLREEQFMNKMYDYLPHILTDEGKKLFANQEKIIKRFPGFGDDLGYGRKFNPFGKSRTIKILPDGSGGFIENPNVLEINEFFKEQFGDVLKGKNVFQENIADIYLTRALKNTEIMYDNEYMKTMMDTFGSTLKVGSDVKNGYKGVANYGELREFVRDKARTLANLELEKMKQEGLKVVSGDFRVAFEKHLAKTLDDMGLPSQILDDLGVPMVELNKEQIAKIQKINPSMVKEVNDAIVLKSNQSRKLQIAKDQSRFLQLYDKFTHFIKLNQTTILPSFHARNKMSNTFNNWLEIGADAVNVDFQKKAFQAMKNDGQVSGVLKITRPDGKVGSIEWSELYRIAKEYEVIDDGFFAKDIGVGAESSGIINKLPKGLDPTDTKNFVPYKKGAEIGGLIENQDKLIHFASQISRGMSVEDAAESVKKYLFDYSDLTAFEKSVMKRVIPYYTWLRKNSALQLEKMLDNPKKYQYVAKVMNGIEGMVDEEDKINKAYVNDFAKDWVQTPFNVTNPEGREEPVLWNPNLPFMDIGRIPDPFNASGIIPELFTQVNPLIKTPIEQIINRNVFFDSPIVKEGENQITKRADHVLSQNAMYPVMKGFIGKRGADRGLHTLNTLSGIKMLSYDYDKYKAMKIQELIAKQNKMKK